MAQFDNKRIYFAVKAGGFAPDGVNTPVVVHGLQTIGINTTFNIEDVFEIGQLSTYAQPEELPDVEVTLEKILDGYPLIYHLATPTATSKTLLGRSKGKATFAMSIFGDTQESASGVPNSQVNCSGLFINSLSYSLPSEGNITESVTLVGNHKKWLLSGFTFSGSLFNNTDKPLSGGLQRRQQVVFGTAPTASRIPWGAAGIPGVGVSGFNPEVVPGEFRAHVSEITINADLGREDILELGRKNPYFKFPTLPIQVNTDFVVTTTDGDLVDATEKGLDNNGNNATEQTIRIVLADGTIFDLGSKNKLVGVTQGGGDTGGGNETVTYSFRNGSSQLTITQPNDPAGP
jgi:hypothetical protein